MMVFRRRGRPTFYVRLPTRTGWERRSTGTADRATAKAIERILEDLGPRGKRAWDLLDAVHEDTLSLGELFDAWRMDDLERLRRRVTTSISPAICPAGKPGSAIAPPRIRPSITWRT